MRRVAATLGPALSACPLAKIALPPWLATLNIPDLHPEAHDLHKTAGARAADGQHLNRRNRLLAAEHGECGVLAVVLGIEGFERVHVVAADREVDLGIGAHVLRIHRSWAAIGCRAASV